MFTSIGAKFSASLVTVILLCLVVGGLGIYNSKHIMDANAQNELTHEMIESVLGMRENLLLIETGETGFLLRGDEGYLAPYEEGKEQVRKYLDKVTTLTADNVVAIEQLRLFNAHYRTWLDSVTDPLIEARRSLRLGEITGDDFDAVVESTPSKPLTDKMSAALGKIEAEGYRLLAERQESSHAVYVQSIWMAGIITAFALCVGLVLNFFISRMFRNKLSLASLHINALAEGRLNSQIKVSGNDEVDLLLVNLAKAQSNLRNLIDGIRSSTVSLKDSAASVSTSSGEMNNAASEQADATASMAAAVEELTVSISQITENSNEASYTALQAKESADQGTVTLGLVVEGIRNIASSVQDSAVTVRSLEKQSNEISEIISTITDIADRTNLLALNAAIEAARAGESGRGFAVVADEVRKLAEQTKGSSERISNMVFQIQSITQQASKSMDDSVGLVQQGIERADSVSETINQIKSNADLVSHAIQAITVSMKEQSNVSVEISRNVERVAQMTEENTAAIAQNTQVSQQISDLAGQLSQSVQVFKT